MLELADLAPADEATIKAWLVEHYSDKRKMSRPRIAALHAERDRYAYLRAPAVTKVYRGLRNISESDVEALRAARLSDPVLDKSWTLDPGIARRFAAGEFTIEPAEPGRMAVVLEATVDARALLLDPDTLAGLPGIGDVWHEVWREPLSISIRRELEVLTVEPLRITAVTAWPNTPARADAAARRAPAYSPIRARLDARPLVPWVPDDALAAEYAALIQRAEAEAIRSLAVELRTDSLDSAVASLGLAGATLGRWLSDTRIGQMVRGVGGRARDLADAAWSRGVGRARGKSVTLSREPSAAQLDKWVGENLRRVKSLRAEAIARVQIDLLDAQRRGLSAESLAARWERDGLPVEFGTLRGRALVISRDQLGKLAGDIAEAQQRALGVTHYRWRGRLDSRERLAHWRREGDVFAWAMPPSDGHPGHPVQCRCYAEPVIDAELLERGL